MWSGEPVSTSPFDDDNGSFLEQNWTDIRPKSLRERLAEGPDL
jgi:uncharacterized protein YbdZ (MbtH family)